MLLLCKILILPLAWGGGGGGSQLFFLQNFLLLFGIFVKYLKRLVSPYPDTGIECQAQRAREECMSPQMSRFHMLIDITKSVYKFNKTCIDDDKRINCNHSN